jgi:pSer/pThr/pTyr-binding forkhead associated (FHA) protein
MEVKLKVLAGAHGGQDVKVAGPKFFIGRAEDCQLRPRSDLISRHHCVIIVEERLVAIRDFGSKNGTYVNGTRVASECELKDGDTLKVGPLEFQVQVKELPKKRPPVNSIEEAATRTASTEFDVDVDIASWLTSTPAAAESETRELRSRDTQHIDISAEDTAIVPGSKSSDTPSDAPVESPAETHAASEKKGPARIPLVSAKDSHSAAAEMLRKMRRR